MGMKTTIANRSSFDSREMSHTLARTSLHRARVTAVHVEKGTVSLSFEKISYTAEALIPLLGLSAPVEGDSANFFNSSWGRYIPQVGDVLLAGFGPGMEVHLLGYSALFYKGFQIKDEDSESSGGIGWGTVQQKQVKPGDWDFKSSRGSVLYLGDRAVIGSRTCKTTYNQSTQDVVSSALLMVNEAGPSDIRYGAVRRLVLPTDTEETYILSGRGISYCQEFTAATKWDPGTGPIDLAFYSQGDVVEELSGTNIIKISSNGMPVRRWSYLKDITGLITTYEESVDALGNVDAQSNTSVSVSYLTPLAGWSITCRDFNVASSTSMDFSAGVSIGMSATAKIDLTALMVNLGGPAGTPLVKLSPTLVTAWAACFSTSAAAFSALAANTTVSPNPGVAATFTSAAAASTAMASALVGTIKVKGE